MSQRVIPIAYTSHSDVIHKYPGHRIELAFLTVVLNLSFWKSPLGEVSTVLLIATKKFYKFPGNLISHLPQNSRQICKQVFQTVLNFCSTEIYFMKSTLEKKLKTRDVWH